VNKRCVIVLSTVLFALSLAGYVTSFFLPAFDIVVEGKHDVSPGYAAFLLSLINFGGLGGGRPFLVWLANPAFVTGVIMFAVRRAKRASLAAGAAAVFGMGFAFEPYILVGYYVWLGSMVLLLGASLARAFSQPSSERP
jgi:hypothetical protein